jgi:tetratricopeptide (TPR) repeat protein
MATRLLPESAEALHSRGLLYQRQGMHPQAILDFDATIDRNPFVGAPYAARGQSFVATNQYDKAIEDFNAALNVNNKDADSWAWRGVAFERKGDRSQALESYQRALSLDNSNSVARQGSSRLQGGVAGLFRS